MGIDEAGRGPVLGPMVYASAFCPLDFSEELASLGFADSKTLTHQKRMDLFEALNQRSGQIDWNVKVMSPSDISMGMSRRSPYNLNAQAFDATVQIIQAALDHQYNLQHIYVDTLGPPKTHQLKLQKAFPNLQFTVCSKADSIYPIVSAASIVAKVTRDAIVENWVFVELSLGKRKRLEEVQESDAKDSIWDLPTGSGYPADPNTTAWLKSHFDKVFGYPQLARFSWATVKTLLTDRGAQVKWNDEPAKIQTWFKDGQSTSNSDPPTLLSKHFGLQAIGSL
ncbi:ribonuclease H-like domain-containing protein [Melampsora americana]|nr:ribonuclease H-like domain-containing protein [Melampsora americana]